MRCKTEFLNLAKVRGDNSSTNINGQKKSKAKNEQFDIESELHQDTDDGQFNILIRNLKSKAKNKLFDILIWEFK